MNTEAPVSGVTPRAPDSIDRVVVGVDGSEPSRIALRWANFVATATGSTLQVVAVWQATTSFGLMGEGWGAPPPDWNPAEIAADVLETLMDDVFDDRRPVGLVARVEEGNTAQVLLDLSVGARMLVVGSRGHGGFASLLLGSVSAACTEHATCPVLVVHGGPPPPQPPPQPLSPPRTDPSS